MTSFLGPFVCIFPVEIPAAFLPTDIDADGTDLGPTGKVCPGYSGDYKPRWGGGFTAPRGAKKQPHRAIDIMAAEGAIVCSVGPGIVERSGTTPKGGHCLYVRDPNGWVWYYAHMRDPSPRRDGDFVRAGDTLGRVGRTGNAVRRTREGLRGCPHLHLSLTAPNAEARRWARAEGLAVLGDKVDSVPLLTLAKGPLVP